MLVNREFKHGFWLVNSTAASQPEAMLTEATLTGILLNNPGPW